MKKALLAASTLASSGLLAADVQGQLSLDDAWVAWRKGNIENAEEIAAEHVQTAGGRHLLTFCAFAKGKYAEAEGHYRAIDRAYAQLDQLDDAMLHAFLHLHRYAAAVRFAKDQAMDKAVQAKVEARARKPFRATLDKLTQVPFTDHPLTPYFPAFRSVVNGDTTIVHLDTGGTWLVMGPDRAEKLGIELVKAGKGLHGTKQVLLQRGTAASFSLGDAVLKNVPVVGMPTLTGQQDFVILGTNVLQQFHSTLDYPNRMLRLSPRGDKGLTKEHMEVHTTEVVEVPFFMWGDHYMFARGGFGKHRNLNFFIDSGLVALDSSEGELRQACFMATPKHYEEWGVERDRTTAKFFECELPISLGPLEQMNQYFTTTAKTIAENLGGVHIDGLISHAFLKEYVWTLDFDRMCYVFSKPDK